MSSIGGIMSYAFTSATTVTTSVSASLIKGMNTFQATIFSTSTSIINGACTIQVSNDNVGWLNAGTCTPSGTGTASDGFVLDAPWKLGRVIVTTLTTGVGASIVASMGG